MMQSMDQEQDRASTVRLTAGALAAGLVLRLLFLHFHPRFLGDTLAYGDLAHNLLAHHVYGFTEDVIRPTLIRLPGYPLFLAACFAVFGHFNYMAVLWVQVAADLVTCALLGKLAARSVSRRAGIAVTWLATLCPFTANYAAAALTETLSLLCVTLAFFALERIYAQAHFARQLRWAAVAGAALAFGVLLRPDQGLLTAAVLPAILWLGWKHQPIKRVLFLAGTAAALVLLPLLLWGARNWRVFHVIQPLAPRFANDPGEAVPYGFQRWYRTWAVDFKSTVDVYWTYDGSIMRLQDLPGRAFDTRLQRQQTAALFARYNAESSATPAFDQAFEQLAEQRIAAHPVRFYVLLPFARELNMWLRPRTELMKLPLDWWNFRAHAFASAFELGYGLLDAVYLVLAVAGLYRMLAVPAMSGRRTPIVVTMVGFVLLRCALLLTIDNSEPRYTLECFPVVIVLAGCAVAERHPRNFAGKDPALLND